MGVTNDERVRGPAWLTFEVTSPVSRDKNSLAVDCRQERASPSLCIMVDTDSTSDEQAGKYTPVKYACTRMGGAGVAMSLSGL